MNSADQQQPGQQMKMRSPLPTEPHTRRPFRAVAFVTAAFLLVLALAITLFLQGWPGPQVIPGSLLLLPPALLVSFYLSVLFHEMGHLLAAAALRFHFVLMNVGPLRLAQQWDGLSLSYRPRQWLLLGGESYCVPTVPTHLQRQQLLFVAAGPAASWLQLLLLLQWRWAWQEGTISFWSHQLLTGLVFFAVLFILLTVLPLPVTPNDAQQFRQLLLHPFTGRRKRLLLLRAASVSGQRPRSYNQRWLAHALACRDGSWEEWFANQLAYLHALDREQPQQAASHLRRCLEIAPAGVQDQQRSYLEAAYFAACQRHNAAAARFWLNKAFDRQHHFHREIAQPLLRAQAAVLLAEGQPSAAVRAAKSSLSLLATTTDIGTAHLERCWLSDLLTRAHMVVPHAT